MNPHNALTNPRNALIAIALCLPAVACSSDGGEASADASITPGLDASSIVDASVPTTDAMLPPPPDATLFDCPPVLDVIDFVPTTAQIGVADPNVRFVRFALPQAEGGGPTDLVPVVFPEPGGEFALGSFPVEGGAATPDCFRCFSVQTAFTPTSFFAYVAEEGTISIDSVTKTYSGSFAPPTGQETATLTWFTFNNDGTSTAHPECTIESETFSWDVPVPF